MFFAIMIKYNPRVMNQGVLMLNITSSPKLKAFLLSFYGGQSQRIWRRGGGLVTSTCTDKEVLYLL